MAHPMDGLLELLNKIEREIERRDERRTRRDEPFGVKEELQQEIENTYLFYALQVCQDKLNGNDFRINKSKALKTEQMQEQVHKLNL